MAVAANGTDQICIPVVDRSKGGRIAGDVIGDDLLVGAAVVHRAWSFVASVRGEPTTRCADRRAVRRQSFRGRGDAVMRHRTPSPITRNDDGL